LKVKSSPARPARSFDSALRVSLRMTLGAGLGRSLRIIWGGSGSVAAKDWVGICRR